MRLSFTLTPRILPSGRHAGRRITTQQPLMPARPLSVIAPTLPSTSSARAAAFSTLSRTADTVPLSAASARASPKLGVPSRLVPKGFAPRGDGERICYGIFFSRCLIGLRAMRAQHSRIPSRNPSRIPAHTPRNTPQPANTRGKPKQAGGERGQGRGKGE